MSKIRRATGSYRPYMLRGRGRYDADNISLSLILIITISKNNELTVNPMVFLYILYDNILLSLLLLLYLYTFVRSNPYSPITYPSRGGIMIMIITMCSHAFRTRTWAGSGSYRYYHLLIIPMIINGLPVFNRS